MTVDTERKQVKRPSQSNESSEEEDEDEDDDDDFIDDGSDVEHPDYSHYIRELFGYDRRQLVIFLVFTSAAVQIVRSLVISFND